jgi:hypothetical protein
MTAIVFIPRHRWHLYFIGFLALGIASRFAVQTFSRRTRETRAGVGEMLRSPATLLVAAGLVAWVAARVYQDAAVRRLGESVLNAPADAVRTEPAQSSSIVEVPDLIARYRMQADGLDRFQYAYYLIATFSRTACANTATVKAIYAASQPFYDDTRNVALDFSNQDDLFRFAFPAYDVKIGKNFGYFRGFDLSGAPAGCLSRIVSVRHPESLPLLITWHMPERWKQLPAHQAITVD